MPAVTTIQLRRSTASTWSTANPILAQGEIGYETDTGKFKIGDGATAWSSLAYGGLTGAASTNVLESYGDGSDGSITISSGVTTLVKDMYYTNLTINSTGSLNPNGYRVFVSNTLDLSSAPAGAIQVNGNAGGSSANQGAGAAAAVLSNNTVGGSSAANAGRVGVVGA